VAGKGEDHVHVERREKFLLTRSDPPFPIRSLTLRAVAISANPGPRLGTARFDSRHVHVDQK
jgi:hypothetical protein